MSSYLVSAMPAAWLSIRRSAFNRYSLQGEVQVCHNKKRRPGELGGLRNQSAISRSEVPQHILQNAAVPEVLQLVDCIYAADQRNAFKRSIGADDLGKHALARLEVAVKAADRHLLAAAEAKRLPGNTLIKNKGNDAHADEV